jgi:hypothetical protein
MCKFDGVLWVGEALHQHGGSVCAGSGVKEAEVRIQAHTVTYSCLQDIGIGHNNCHEIIIIPST